MSSYLSFDLILNKGYDFSSKFPTNRQVGQLLRDWRRVNVAFTRAKVKLIVVGSRSTLEHQRPMSEFIDHMRSQNWIYTLPLNADTFHDNVDPPPASSMENIKPVHFTTTESRKRKTISSQAILANRSVLRETVYNVVM